MNELTIFAHKDFGEIRVVSVTGEPWWVLRDVCKALGLTYTNKVVKRLDEDERKLFPVIDRMGRTQKASAINESGLYSVILRSDKPEAKAFKRWVTHDILPAIRKSGSYQLPHMTTAEIVAQLAQVNVDMEKRIDDIEQKMAEPEALPVAQPQTGDWKDRMDLTIKSLIEKNHLNPCLYRARLYRSLELAENVNIDARLRNLKARLKKQGYTSKDLYAVTKLDVISREKRLKAAFESIVSAETAS